jgi:hypothetical protein
MLTLHVTARVETGYSHIAPITAGLKARQNLCFMGKEGPQPLSCIQLHSEQDASPFVTSVSLALSAQNQSCQE